MKPSKSGGNKIFEKVPTGELIEGTIMDIQYEQEHPWKPFEGKVRPPSPAVRFVFELLGCQFKHRSKWISFNYGEKSNLYQKFISKLVEGARPDMDFDLDELKGFKVRTLWSDNGDFQNLDTILPLNRKLVPMGIQASQVNDKLDDIVEPEDLGE